MKKILLILMIMGITANIFAANGDVNFGNNLSPSNHAMQYQLVFKSNMAATSWTNCIGPATGYTAKLYANALVGNSGDAFIKIRDCSNNRMASTVGRQSFFIKYEPQYSYNIACSVNDSYTITNCQ